MEKINLSNVAAGSNVTVSTTTTFRVLEDGSMIADSTVRKNTTGLAGNPKSGEVVENYTHDGTPDEVKNKLDEAKISGDFLTTNNVEIAKAQAQAQANTESSSTTTTQGV